MPVCSHRADVKNSWTVAGCDATWRFSILPGSHKPGSGGGRGGGTVAPSTSVGALSLYFTLSLSLFVYTWQLSLLFDSTRLWETMMSCSVVDSGCRFGHADGLQYGCRSFHVCFCTNTSLSHSEEARKCRAEMRRLPPQPPSGSSTTFLPHRAFYGQLKSSINMEKRSQNHILAYKPPSSGRLQKRPFPQALLNAVCVYYNEAFHRFVL